MKIEFIGRKYGGLDETSCIYITKGELLRAYESDKQKAFFDLNGIVEMFTTPACFNQSITEQAFEKICNVYLKKLLLKVFCFPMGKTNTVEPICK